MKTLFFSCVLAALLGGCSDTGNGTVDNQPSRRHTIGPASDEARSYAAGGGNLTGRPPYVPPSRR